MRIALISTPFVPVPPTEYGGTELVVAELGLGLSAAGHAVTVFTCGGSAERVPPFESRALYPGPVWPPEPYAEVTHAAWAIEQILAEPTPFDVVHAHLPAALAFSRFLPRPLVYTVHHEADARTAGLYQRAHAIFVAISARQRALQALPGPVIHHGVSPVRYPIGRGRGGYVAYLGRFSAEKGVHLAIDVARRAGWTIRLAGKPHPPDRTYFEARVRPRLSLPGVQAIGEVGGLAKARLLRDARALLFPIAWEEPFGLVMIEAMLCGTPVLAFARGAVPEVVEDGVTGFICRDEEEMVLRLATIDRLDRRACARRARARFSSDRMVAEHLELYEAVARGQHGGRELASPCA